MLARYDFADLTSARTRTPLEQAFRTFCRDFEIVSKEKGLTKLRFYNSQELSLRAIMAGLKRGVHHFTILKGRQLGISTFCLALDLFWLIVFKGTQGAIVVDDESNRDQFKATITGYLGKLPAKYRVGVRSHNRNQLVLSNGSVLFYIIAGTKRKGSFGHGKGLNFVHATELSRYGDAEAWASFVSALAEEHPWRLFIYESTARGYNLFNDVWEEAVDSVDKAALFLGWWTKETYRLKRGSPRYNQVMPLVEYTADEEEGMRKVKEGYNVEVDDEQVAWWRAKGRELGSRNSEGYLEQEFPWTADDAFRLSGRVFFPLKQVNELVRQATGKTFMGFRFHFGDTYETVELEQVKNVREAELRVWEQPSAFGEYSLGADPAYGTAVEGNTWHDLFAISVLRCYADKVVQVAEYAVNDIDPYKFAWVIAFLCGWYKKTRLVLELTGPGTNVLKELQHVQRELQTGYRAAKARELGINNALAYMAHYLYIRPDSLSSSMLLQMKASTDTKSLMLRRLKDAIMLRTIDIRSVPLLREMPKIIDGGGTIAAEGRAKDDRTLGIGLAYRGYDDWLRPMLANTGATYEAISSKEARAALDTKLSFQQHIVQAHFAGARRVNPDHPPGEWKFTLSDRIPLPS